MKRESIDEHLGSNITEIMEDLLEENFSSSLSCLSGFDQERIVNFTVDFGEETGTDHWPCDECCKEGDPVEIDCHTGLCKECYEEDILYNSKDILEWYIVTPFLGEALVKEGEAVLKNLYGYFWGRVRKTMIFEDPAIKNIFKEVEKHEEKGN